MTDLAWGRRPNLDLVLAHLSTRFRNGAVPGAALAEIGGLRSPGNVEGDGCATVAWGQWGECAGRYVYTVDPDPGACHNARALRLRKGWRRLEVVHRRGEAWIGHCARPLLLLYLDGADDPEGALWQAAAGWPKIVPGGVLLVDDAHVKAPLVSRWMAGLVRTGEAEPFPGLDPACNQEGWVRL